MATELDIKDFIDRTAEQEIFAQMLELRDSARLLAIRDAGGRGKSTLLRRLKYNCEWGPGATRAVSLVPLDQLPDPTPFSMIAQIREDLTSFELSFPVYDRLNAARLSFDFTPFGGSGPIVASLDARGATISGQENQFIALQIENAGVVNVAPRTSWGSPEQERIARRECVTAFLKDLHAICRTEPVVLLFDAWERSGRELQGWIFNTLLRQYCFDLQRRPEQLIVVLAGRELPSWIEPKARQLVRTVEQLSEWQESHVAEFLAVNGYPDIAEEDIHYLCLKLRAGLSLERALMMISVLIRSGQPNER